MDTQDRYFSKRNWLKKTGIIVCWALFGVFILSSWSFANGTNTAANIASTTGTNNTSTAQTTLQLTPVMQTTTTSPTSTTQARPTTPSPKQPTPVTATLTTPMASAVTTTSAAPTASTTALALTPAVKTQQQPATPAATSPAQQYDPNHLFPKPNDLQKEAYQSAIQQAMPMTPEQILRLKEMRTITQRAAASPAGTPPKPVLSSRSVNLTPGATPPIIRLQQGFVTSVVFVDSTGANWPIASYDLGNSNAFDIQWQPNSNTLMIQATSMYTYGNLAVSLKGLSTPVMLTLVPGQQLVDYRVDLHIQRAGPNALPSHRQTWGPVSNILLGVLDGIPPKNATSLETSDASCQAWLSGDKMYIRTRLAILSPGWLDKTSSSDGTSAYEMEKSPTILVSKNGQPFEINIEGL